MNTTRSGIPSVLEAGSPAWNIVLPFVLWGTLAAFVFAYLYHFLRYASLPVH